MDILKLLSASEIFAHIVGFLILLFILRTFLWKRIFAVLDARKEKVAGEFKNIEDAKSEIEKIKAGYAEKLGAIEEAARVKMQEVVSEAKHVSQEMKEQAQKDAQKMMLKAQENIEIEMAKVKEVLKDKIIDLTVLSSERMLKEKITSEKDKVLISSFLEEINKTSPLEGCPS